MLCMPSSVGAGPFWVVAAAWSITFSEAGTPGDTGFEEEAPTMVRDKYKHTLLAIQTARPLRSILLQLD